MERDDDILSNSQPPSLHIVDVVESDDDVLVRWNNTSSRFQKLASNISSHRAVRNKFIRDESGHGCGQVHYVRNLEQMRRYEEEKQCSSVTAVLPFLLEELSKRVGTLLMAYGSLIHINREKDLVNSDGEYLDDDIDLWASASAMYGITQIEPELFTEFGWSFRTILGGDGYIQLMQLLSVCGHEPSKQISKVNPGSGEPSLEVYQLNVMTRPNVKRLIKDMWQGTQLLEADVYPSKQVVLNSTKFSQPLRLQVPNEPLKVLSCLYGNWTIPSTAHASMRNKCF